MAHHVFPQPSSNPWGVRPTLFGCVFGLIQGSDSIVACAYGLDPRAAREPRAWAKPWGEAMQMCGWSGGRIDGRGLDDFVCFGAKGHEWLARSGSTTISDPLSMGAELAEAAVDYLADRYGAPRARFSSLCWTLEGRSVSRVLEQAPIAKRLLLVQWEADQIALGMPESARSGGFRL